MSALVAATILTHVIEWWIVVTVRTQRESLEEHVETDGIPMHGTCYSGVVVGHVLNQFEFVQRTFQFFERFDLTALWKIVGFFTDFTVQTARTSFNQLHVSTAFSTARMAMASSRFVNERMSYRTNGLPLAANGENETSKSESMP